MIGTVSLGLAGALGAETVAALAPAVEAAGFATLWINDTPGGDALTALAAAARVTDRLRLATGVVPIDRRPPAALAAELDAAGLPPERTTLGIGSGQLRAGALERVREAVALLRESTGARIVVGALGPRMRRLGANASDGVLLNWLTPAAAGEQTRELHALAPRAQVSLYVRTALDPAAFERLRRESARYASLPTYAANLDRLGIAVADTVIVGEDALAHRIPAYRAGVDDVVLRAITPDDTLASYRDFLARAGAVA